MANNRIKLDGFEELRAALTRLPAELTGDAKDIVFANAEEAAREIGAAYPRRTGDLKDHLSVTKIVGQFSVRAVVKNTSKHALTFETGSQARHNAIGANRGSMPPANVFYPTILRRRRTMYEVLKTMLVSKGLMVSGDA